jgi:hypothetical protein
VHDHSFSSIISKLSSHCHHVPLKSCIGPSLGVQLSTCPLITSFQMDSNIFSSTLHNRLGFPHPMVCGLSWCICSQPIDLLRIHVFHYVHGANCTTTHDVVWDSFTSIVRDVEFHVLHEQTHVFSMPCLQSYCVYIIWYLHFNRHSHCWFNSCKSCFTNHFFSRNYHDNYSLDKCSLDKGCVISWSTPRRWFIPLAIKIFACLHQQANNFLHQCVNMAWSTKGFGGPYLLILHSFYK